MTYKQTFELESLPKQIEKLEQEINDIEIRLADPDFYTEDAGGFQHCSKRLVMARREKDNAEARWLELEELRQSYEASGRPL